MIEGAVSRREVPGALAAVSGPQLTAIVSQRVRGRQISGSNVFFSDKVAAVPRVVSQESLN